MSATATSSPSPDLPNPPQSNDRGEVPDFEHVVLIVLENQDYESVIGSDHMPQLNRLAQQNVLLSNYFAVEHPSLPNYIALVSGDTQDITSDCSHCFVDQPNLADLLEASGRTWKAYEEDMPSPCFVGDAGGYVQKHDPFIYFDSIRLNADRCQRSIVPMTQLDHDLASNQFPNFAFVMPNLCHSAHDCSLETADSWVNDMVKKLQASPGFGQNTLIAITFDEGDKHNTSTCCGVRDGGGKVATVLISPHARHGFVDGTAYSHYALLKTLLVAWGLPDLGQTRSRQTQPILSPWILGNGQSEPQAPTPGASLLPQASYIPLADGELAFPIRAAFYYPWFPEAWTQAGMYPFTHYHPTLGYYSVDDVNVVQAHIAAMQYGKIQVGISSWWGQGHVTDLRVPSLLDAASAANFRWTLYYEDEGYEDPSIESIRSDLEYIRDNYAVSAAYLKIDGRFVVFVYADPNDGCGMASRWAQANTVGAYIALKVFPGYRTCADQPDTWHQYGPAVAEDMVVSQSFSISPGFWKADEGQPRLERDLERWNLDIQTMVSAPSKFHLITTFNEWGEGTSVESATEWESQSGFGLFLDALHYDGLPYTLNLPLIMKSALSTRINSK